MSLSVHVPVTPNKAAPRERRDCAGARFGRSWRGVGEPRRSGYHGPHHTCSARNTCCAQTAWDSPDAIVRASASRSVGDSYAVDTMNPEPLAPPNPAIAPLFHAGRRSRRVGELGRSGYHGPHHFCPARNTCRAHTALDCSSTIVRASPSRLEILTPSTP